MRVIGFNFTKVVGEKMKGFKPGFGISTNINFIDIEKEGTDIQKEDFEALRVSFNFSVLYLDKEKKDSKKAEVSLTGFIILMASKEESKNLLKDWSKKEISAGFRVPLFNFILKRCSTRSLQLEEELNLPLHVPMPQVKFGKKESKN